MFGACEQTSAGQCRRGLLFWEENAIAVTGSPSIFQQHSLEARSHSSVPVRQVSSTPLLSGVKHAIDTCHWGMHHPSGSSSSLHSHARRLAMVMSWSPSGENSADSTVPSCLKVCDRGSCPRLHMVTLPFVQTANKLHQSAGHPEEGHRQLMAEHSYICITSKTWQYFFVFAQAPDCKLRQDTCTPRLGPQDHEHGTAEYYVLLMMQT